MTDRELLEWAAKAAGLDYVPHTSDLGFAVREDRTKDVWDYWNPLDLDSDAFRLAVKLWFAVNVLPGHVAVTRYGLNTESAIAELWGGDPFAATRRAIVRAAAEIGKMNA